MKKILFISHRIPFPPDKGDKIRSFNLLKFFSQNFSVDLVSFVDRKSDLHHVKKLEKYCNQNFIFTLHKFSRYLKSIYHFFKGKSLSEGFYYLKPVQKKVDQLIRDNNYHFIFCFSSQVAQFVLDTANQKIIDFCDVDSDKWIQFSKKKSFPLNLVYQIEGRRLARRERIIADHFNTTLFSTAQEAQIFNRNGSFSNFWVLANGVNSEYFQSKGVDKEQSLVFVGAMDYYPNVEAVLWFTKNVFNELLFHKPDIHFYVVGSNPDRKLLRLAETNTNITVTGYAADVRPFLDKAKVAVIPIRIARGIQNKVLEAMAMQTPVVISDTIYKSLHNVEQINPFIFKDSKHLLKILIEIFEDSSSSEYLKIDRNLRQYVVNNYNWDSIFSSFKEHLIQREIW